MDECLQHQQIKCAGMNPLGSMTIAGLLGQHLNRSVIKESTVVLFRIKTRDRVNKGDQIRSNVSVSASEKRDPLHFAKGNGGLVYCVTPQTHLWFIRVQSVCLLQSCCFSFFNPVKLASLALPLELTTEIPLPKQ